jgi:carbon storage regulator
MLVFTRHVGETIIVDGEVVVTILGLEDGQVRLAITAPSHTRIYCAESTVEEQAYEVEPIAAMNPPEPH